MIPTYAQLVDFRETVILPAFAQLQQLLESMDYRVSLAPSMPNEGSQVYEMVVGLRDSAARSRYLPIRGTYGIGAALVAQHMDLLDSESYEDTLCCAVEYKLQPEKVYAVVSMLRQFYQMHYFVRLEYPLINGDWEDGATLQSAELLALCLELLQRGKAKKVVCRF
jgi:hypothetical protein